MSACESSCDSGSSSGRSSPKCRRVSNIVLLHSAKNLRCCSIRSTRFKMTLMQMDADNTLSYISLGSNLGDRAGNLLLAVRGLIEADLVVRRLSTIYETDPLDMDTDLKFLN